MRIPKVGARIEGVAELQKVAQRILGKYDTGVCAGGNMNNSNQRVFSPCHDTLPWLRRATFENACMARTFAFEVI